MAKRFNRATFDSARVQDYQRNMYDICQTVHNTSSRDLNNMRNIVGRPSGTLGMAEFSSSMLVRFNQNEFNNRNRDMYSYDFYGREIDWCNSNKVGPYNWDCFQMSSSMANTLMSLGYNYVQDMGVDGWGYGAVRAINSANIKNDDWQYWDFGMRFGQSYMRFYK